MIIGNLGGFLWLGILILIGASMHGSFSDSNTMNFLFMITTLPVALLLAFVGLKPRIFFIPCWVLSIIAILVFAWKCFGWVSLIGDAAIVAGGIFVLKHLTKKSSEKEWASAQSRLNSLDDGSLPDDQRRKILTDIFITDVNLLERPEVIEHNSNILAHVVKIYGEKFTHEKLAMIKEFHYKLKSLLENKEYEWKKQSDGEQVKKVLEGVLN